MVGDSDYLQAPSQKNICAVIVTYFPDESFPERLRQIRMQVDQVVVVDNGSDDGAFRHVQSSVFNSGAAVIRNCVNLGVATALNQGVQWALERGYAWSLLFDQDTVPYADMVCKLRRAYDEFPQKHRLAALGCNRFLKPRPQNSSLPRYQWWTASKAIITSGTLLSLSATRSIGLFRDEFFIDEVDFEFCLRARFMGFKIVEILEPIMDHCIGNPKPIRLLRSKKRTANHRPWRWYYRVRNKIILLREYFWKDPAWAVQAVFSSITAATLALLFEDARILKLKYMTLGLSDGVTGHFTRNVTKK